LRHLEDVLEKPKVLTSERLLKELSIVDSLDIATVEGVARARTSTKAFTYDERPLTPPTEEIEATGLQADQTFHAGKTVSPTPGHFIVRPDGKIVPLIPADELPAGLDFIGVERAMKIEETRGMLSLGLVQSSGGIYQLQHSSKYRAVNETDLQTPPSETLSHQWR
jgi:hypothetical protein